MSPEVKVNLGAPAPRVVVGRLDRFRRNRSGESPAAALKPAPEPRPARAAYQLVVAHWVARALQAGEVPGFAAVARDLGVSRPRVTQISRLAQLSPGIQEAILALRAVGASEPAVARILRDVLRHDAWAVQEAVWAASQPRREVDP